MASSAVARGGGARLRTGIAASLGGVLTLVVLLTPAPHVGIHNLAARVAVETSATLIAGLVAVLLYGRYRRTQRLRDLLLVYAIAMVGITALVSVAKPGLAPVVGLGCAVLILAAALVSPYRVLPVARPSREVARVAIALAAVSLLVMLPDGVLPGVVDIGRRTDGTPAPTLDSQPLLLAVQLAGLASYVIAAFVSTREARRTGDDLVAWLGAASAIGAWAWINCLRLPTENIEWLALGDLLRLGFLVMLLIGAVRQIQEHWGAQVVAAAHDERRRMARDLHDGVVQELGYIRSTAMRQRGSHQGFASEVVAAADRALGEARRSIDALAEHPNEDLAATLRRAAADVSQRYDLTVHLSLAPHVPVLAAQGEALVRIMREAVSNAARHAASDGVWINLTAGELTVRDEGQGFEPATDARPGSFGLTGMKERAASVGAVVKITSILGTGTTVMTTW